MNEQKYSVNQHLIESIITWVKDGEIAIPEIQRPFVWDSSPAIEKDRRWIDDISPIITNELRLSKVVNDFCTLNEDVDRDKVEDVLENLKSIVKKQIGLIELSGDLDIEKVTEIFIRINSQGVELSQADFVMSKIAANEEYGGNVLRKCIDYFSHLSVAPEFYPNIAEFDKDFSSTEYFRKISWLKSENDTLYDPTYKDVLRVSFTYKFSRGRLSDLVSLLSGRNFETRDFEEEIAIDSYAKLKEGVLDFVNETNFKKFIMVVKSAGFVDERLIRSQNALIFAYILFLKLREQHSHPALIEKYVKKWFVLSILTGRYSGSTESIFDFDIKNISSQDFGEYLNNVENARLSDAFWTAELIQKLNTSVSSSPVFNVFLAAQCKMNNRGFLSKSITVKDLIEQRGDVHHLFPRAYLKTKGMQRGQYNQVANYVFTQSETNIQIGNKAPNIYFNHLLDQCNGGSYKYGGIIEMDDLRLNMKENCIPESIFEMTHESFQEFVEERRILISNKIRHYYESL